MSNPAMPTIEERVERLEAWTEVAMSWLSRMGDRWQETMLTDLEKARKLHGRADDPHRELHAEIAEDEAG
jgi:hypothetical protein